jgi:hypothetical protein
LGCNGSANALDAHNAESSDETADCNIDKHGFLSVFRSQPECDDSTANNDDPGVDEEARRNDQMLHVVDVVDRGLYGSVGRNDDGANDALEASDLSDETKTLFEEDGGENGADNDG